MYWPNGVPRIYAVNGPAVRHAQVNDDDADAPVHGAQEQGQTHLDETREDTLVNQEQRRLSTRAGRRSKETAWANDPVLDLCVSRHGHLFATMTVSSVAIWQTRPTAVVAALRRSDQSLKKYGPNVSLQLRPDAAIVVVQTQYGYLIAYSIAVDNSFRAYQQYFTRNGPRRSQIEGRLQGPDPSGGFREVSLRFRVAFKADSGIQKALVLDNEIVIATEDPAAIQMIRWTPDENGNQTRAMLLKSVPWLLEGETIVDMVYDRAMSIYLWVSNTGNVYAVQRVRPEELAKDPRTNFKGHRFHTVSDEGKKAAKVAVNARFSLFAVACSGGSVYIYTAKDYTGNIPLTHTLHMPASACTTGPINVLTYSPDGFCLFAGYQNGWTTWSVFGKPGGTSFHIDRSRAITNGEAWLTGISTAFWVGGGSEIILTCPDDNRIFFLEMARSALTGHFSSANLARALLQTSSEIIMYCGHDISDLTTISGKDYLWHHAQFPPAYLRAQGPIRMCVASQDGRYVAIAGRRGLAHYSVHSGRWKGFEDPETESSFSVQGGMCWYGHILIAAVECDDSYELRLYSRELSLTRSSILFTEKLDAPAVFIGPSGEDSLLVYTYDNILYHYVINATSRKINLVQVGQIAFHGIVRSPSRVRAISWVLPENQLRDGDPAQDVSVASVLFLVDGKLVLLQPSVSETGDLKYDMRIVAHDVENYILMRDQLAFNFSPPTDEPQTPSSANFAPASNDIFLRDSLWVSCGNDLLVWPDVQDITRPAQATTEEIPKPVSIPVEFYPLSILLNKGIVLGAESELSQRRDLTFSISKYAIRIQLFLPYVLKHSLANLDTPAALSVCHHFSHLSYFPHALEVLLHHVLDDEVDYQDAHNETPDTRERLPLLPSVLSFLQASIPTQQFLDIVVQCTRKTELRSWRTLFAYLPPPSDLFEQALKLGLLKTAGGYLLVLQALEINEEGSDSRVEDSCVRLLKKASDKLDWELCAELARFLKALDHSGDMLRRAFVKVGLRKPEGEAQKEEKLQGLGLTFS